MKNRLIVDWLPNGAPGGRSPELPVTYTGRIKPISLKCRPGQRFRWLVRRPAPSEEEEVLEVARDSRVARRKASEPHLEPQTIDIPSELV